MRIVVFFVSLFTFLLCGGHYLHANTPHPAKHCLSKQHLAKSERPKLSVAGQDMTIIEEADLDLDEEHLNGEGIPVKNIHQDCYAVERWYLNYYSLLTEEEDHQQHVQSFQPSTGNSSPIYIRQRVLRI